jgi:hypothetical protein
MKIEFTREELNELVNGLYSSREFVLSYEEEKPINTLIDRLETIITTTELLTLNK